MRPRANLLLPLSAVAVSLAACVSLDEAPLARGVVLPGQRTLVIAYAPPTLFFTEGDSKAESAAKLLPGLGLVVADAQNERDVKASKDLHQYLPAWDATGRFMPHLMKGLELSGWPGKFITPGDAELQAGELAKLNGATHMAEWRERYYFGGPETGIARNYSRFLALDDALVLEANFAPGAVSDGEGEITPTLSLAVRIFRANTMRQVWRHEETVELASAKREPYDYKVNPTWLLGAWEAMMPELANKMSEALRKNLQESGAFVMPTQGVAPEPGPGAPPPQAPAPAPAVALPLAQPEAPAVAQPVSAQPPPAAPPAGESVIR